MYNPNLINANLKFEFLQEIGQEGKNSRVFISKDKQLDCEIVVKEIPKTSFEDDSLFFSEAQKLSMSSHPNVVDIKFACQSDDNIYLSMPYYKNGSLKKAINLRFLTVREILRFSIHFLSGLHHIHTKGLIHFDIKPDNILISNSNEALLSDFGLSKAINNFGFAEMGLAYDSIRPPDSFIQTEHTKKYDIYQAGLTLYRMCNGDIIFYQQFDKICQTGEDYEKGIMNGIFPDRKHFLFHIPKSLKKIILKMLEINQDVRYGSVLEILNDLSLINEVLDWQYSNDKNIEILSKSNNTHIFNVIIEKKNDFFDIETTKIRIDNQKSLKVNDGCINGILGTKLGDTILKLLKIYD
jgi:eukaryotic-like serine/threonine-protein kinase